MFTLKTTDYDNDEVLTDDWFTTRPKNIVHQ